MSMKAQHDYMISVKTHFPSLCSGVLFLALSLRVATAAALVLIATQGTDDWSVPWALF